MSIVNFSPYHQYLYSPNSYLHTVPANYKIVFTIVYICSIPFSYYTFIITIYIIILTYWNFYKYLKMKYSYKNRLSTNIFVYIVIIGILLLSSRQIVAKNYTCTEMNYPYLIIKNSLLIINLRFIYIPNILLKACLIIYHTISLLYTLFHTTRLENINLILLSIFYKSPKKKNLFNQLLLFSCSISSQLLYIIIAQIRSIIISIQIRKIDQLHIKNTVYILYFTSFIYHIMNHVKSMTYTLYTKEIEKNFFYLISI